MSQEPDGQVPGPLSAIPPIELAPAEFETFVAELFGQASPYVDGLMVTPQERIRGVDGDYDLDATVRYRWAGMDFLVVVEAKRHTGAIERQFVQVLDSKRASVGAHKAVLVSTAPFQSGAIEFADVHGIALVHIGGELQFVLRRPSNAPAPAVVAVARLWQGVEGGRLRSVTVSGRPQKAAHLLLDTSPADPDPLER